MSDELRKTKLMPKKALESTIFVGDKANPIGFIKRKEIESYLDHTFYNQYNLWKRFHNGFGLPLNKSWAEHPAFLMDIIELFIGEYKALQA